MDPLWEFALVLGCLVASGFFSGSETALLRLRAHHIEADLRTSSGMSALAARSLVATPARLLVTILLGNNVVNILAASVAASLSVHYLGQERGILVSTIAMTFVVLIFCEILPKALAARNPRGVGYAVALPLYLVHKVLRPVHWAFDHLVEPVVRRLAGHEGEDSVAEEVLELARKLQIDHRSAIPVGIIANAARAIDRVVADVMVPRADIFAAPESLSAEAMLERLLQERYTRVPVYRESIDDFSGCLHLKDLIALSRSGESDVRGAINPVLRVPAGRPVLELLRDMQRTATPLAIVKDEFGVTQGLVTQEDLLEELVGEIRDEFDQVELQNIRKLEDGSFLVRGATRLADVTRDTGWTLPGAPGQTVGGLTFEALGRPARRGDLVRVDGFEITVTSCSGTRLQEVRLQRPPPPALPEDGSI